MRKICVFTGTRAEYGLLRPVLKLLHEAADVELFVLVTGTHLTALHGYTVNEIEADGFGVCERVEILADDGLETPIEVAVGQGVIRFSKALSRLQPDLLIVLGDRYEALAIATAATVCKVPIAHIHGGELSYGSMDDVFRHAITKMSHLHFASTEAYRKRIIQMGEHPAHVFYVGALGVENALKMPLASRNEVEQRLGLAAGQPYAMATYHPATLEDASPQKQLLDLIEVLRQRSDFVTVFTGANADAHGAALNDILVKTARDAPERFRYFASLGAKMYLSAVKYSVLVIGNSSSGIIETPTFHVPTIDIGRRQAGRIRAASVIAAKPELASIQNALARAFSADFQGTLAGVNNPYEKPGTAENVAYVIRSAPLYNILVKRFCDISFSPDAR